MDEVRLAAVAVREERPRLMRDVPTGHQHLHAVEERSLKAGYSDEMEPGHLQHDQDRLETPDLAVVSVEVPRDTGPDCMPRWSASIPATLSTDQTGMCLLNEPAFLELACPPVLRFCPVFVGASIGCVSRKIANGRDEVREGAWR